MEISNFSFTIEEKSLDFTDNFSEIYVPYEICEALHLPNRKNDYQFIGYWTKTEYVKNNGIFSFLNPWSTIIYDNPTMVKREIANQYEFDHLFGSYALCPALTFEQLFDIFRIYYDIDITYKRYGTHYSGKISYPEVTINYSGYDSLRKIKQIIAIELIKIQKELDRKINY